VLLRITGCLKQLWLIPQSNHPYEYNIPSATLQSGKEESGGGRKAGHLLPHPTYISYLYFISVKLRVWKEQACKWNWWKSESGHLLDRWVKESLCSFLPWYSISANIATFMQPKGSLLCSQGSASGTHSEPDASSLILRTYLFKIHNNIILPRPSMFSEWNVCISHLS
jgi:hypothetical protein